MNWRRGVYELDGISGNPPVPAGFEGPPPRSADPLQIIEPTAGWWRNAGAFGQRYQGFPPASAGEVIPLTEQLNLPGPPKPWWMQLYRFARNNGVESINVGNWEMRARFIYGVGGIQNTIDVDLIQGVQFPIVCNSVTVQLVSYQPTNFAGSVYDPGEVKFTAGVMFGEGGGGGSLPPTYTSQWRQKAGAFALQELLPDFARSVGVKTTVRDATELDNCFLAFLDLGGQVLAELSLGYARSYSIVTGEKGVPIPAGTNSVILTLANPAVADGHRACLQFFLAL